MADLCIVGPSKMEGNWLCFEISAIIINYHSLFRLYMIDLAGSERAANTKVEK